MIATTVVHAAGYPAYVALPGPVKIKGEVEVESYGQVEFTLRDKIELVRGKTRHGQLDATGQGAQDKRYFAPFARTPSRKKYVEDNQVQDVFLRGGALTPFFDEQIDAMRRTLREAGVAAAR